MGIKANDLDNDLKNFKNEDQTIATVEAAELTNYLHISQDDALASGTTAERVKKFFDFIPLHVFLPWLRALTEMLNESTTNTGNLSEDLSHLDSGFSTLKTNFEKHLAEADRDLETINAALAEKGYFPKEDLLTLRHLGSYLQGHPDMKHIPGIDMSSGSLGQGISAAVGMALGAKLQNKAFRVYTLLGDGEIQEGQVWEAAMFAGAKHLDNLVVIVDNNGLQIDGNVADVNSPYPIDKKFEAFNFHVINVADGNDFDQLKAAFDEARTVTGMPTAIITKTVKGKGVSFMENQVGWHGKAPNDEEYAIAMAELEKAGEALCQK